MDENSKPKNAILNSHSYHIEIQGGEVFSGEIPKSIAGVFSPVTFPTYDEEAQVNVFSSLLYDTGIFQLGIGIDLDKTKIPYLSTTEEESPLEFGDQNTAMNLFNVK